METVWCVDKIKRNECFNVSRQQFIHGNNTDCLGRVDGCFCLVYFSVASLSLFFTQAEIFTDWLMEVMDFGRYPAEIYSNYFKLFLLFGLPVLFFSYVPTAILLGKIPWFYALLGIVVVVWLYIISTIIWRKGLKRYQSVSS